MAAPSLDDGGSSPWTVQLPVLLSDKQGSAAAGEEEGWGAQPRLRAPGGAASRSGD